MASGTRDAGREDAPGEPGKAPFPAELGARLAAQEGRLRLALSFLAGRALRARVELEDLVQDVWLRALSHPAELPPASAGEAALRRSLAHLARRVVLDAARALRAARRDGTEERLALSSRSFGPRASQLAAATDGPPTRLSQDEALRGLCRRFDALSPEHRRVLGLRQFEGLSARETARRMGRTETAIHSLHRRALAAWGLDESP